MSRTTSNWTLHRKGSTAPTAFPPPAWSNQWATLWWKRVLTWHAGFWLSNLRRSLLEPLRVLLYGGWMKRTAGGLLALSPDDFWTENNPLLRCLLCSLCLWIDQCFCSFQCFVCGVTLTAGLCQLWHKLFLPIKWINTVSFSYKFHAKHRDVTWKKHDQMEDLIRENALTSAIFQDLRFLFLNQWAERSHKN